MYTPVFIYKGRTTKVLMSFGIDVSGDVISSKVKVSTEADSPVILTWEPAFLTDGVDGKVILKYEDDNPSEIPYTNAVMDVVRMSGDELYPAFVGTLPVVFIEAVT